MGKGRLSQEEIERMVSDAEKFKAEDDANRNRFEAKNALENYCWSLKSSIASEELKSKMSEDDTKTLETAVENTIKWLDMQLVVEVELRRAAQNFGGCRKSNLGEGERRSDAWCYWWDA